MAVLSDYTSGTITLANGSTAVTGTGTLFDVAKFREGDTLQIQNLTAVIASVNSNTSLTLTAPWSGTSLANAPYRARYLPDGARVTAQATTLIELLGNGVLSNLAELGVEDGKTPVGNAAGEYELKDQSTFGIQDPNGSLGKLAALTLAANKFLSTDTDKNLVQSDITAAAIALLNLSGTAAADRLPYLNGASGTALTPLTPLARNLLDDTTTASMRATISPGKPAFKAHLAANQLVYNGTTNLSYTASPINIGNAWNGSIFTAPEAGNYFFSMGNTLIDGNNGQFILQIFVNGTVSTEIVWGWNSSGVQYYRAGTLSHVVNLAVGSTVQFKLVLDGLSGNPAMQAFRNFAMGFMF
jgi:hypothetical protein